MYGKDHSGITPEQLTPEVGARGIGGEQGGG